MNSLTNDLTAENRGGLLVITLSRPQKANALTLDMNRALTQLLQEARTDGAVRGVLLTGAGERAFCAGVDIHETSELPAAESGRMRSATFFALLLELTTFRKPLVAAVNGVASGGGFMIAALADILVAAEGAYFSLPEINLGTPALAGLVVLEPVLGGALAYDLVQSGRKLSAEEGERRGLVRVVLPREAVFAQAEALARELMGKNARAFAASKAWVRDPVRAGLERAEAAMVRWRAAGGG